jgi:hypothetical protein
VRPGLSIFFFPTGLAPGFPLVAIKQILIKNIIG